MWRAKSLGGPSIRSIANRPRRRSAFEIPATVLARADELSSKAGDASCRSASTRPTAAAARPTGSSQRLWGWSLIPPIESWGNPQEDGFSYVPAFYATIFCLPTGLYLLAGGIAGRGRYVTRGRIALFIGCGVLLVVWRSSFSNISPTRPASDHTLAE
jgi:hypothetical protein